MDRATERIEQHLDYEREQLRSNLAELEGRVLSVVDWRRHFRSNPALWIGCAFAGGLLLARTAARPYDAPEPLEYRQYARAGRPVGYPGHRRREISRAWRTIESALIGVAAAKLKETLAHVLPGFREQLARREGNGYMHAAPANDEPDQHQ